ncbi:MAG TPA: CRTAC1 family protein [Terracidiphilus sp.]|nr:CRTAC1 family protein [Terracidiphilus sp.]
MRGRHLRLFAAIAVAALVASPILVAQRALPANVGSAKTAASSRPAPASVIRFEDASNKAHIDFTHSFGSAQLGSLLEGTGAGCVWLDYNNSGFPSLYVVNGRPLDDAMHPYPLKVKPNPPPHNHLYRNNGDGTFSDVTEQAGLDPEMYSIAVTAADYDNDGFIDLLVTGYGKTILYHNDGNGHFTDVTEKAGIKVEGWAISSTWLDYNRDGCVDLFVGRYVKFDPKYRAYYAADNYPGPLDYEGETNKLFHNNCDGTFTDVTEKSGIGAYVGRTMGVTAADFDNDGWDDIYVANDRTENFLFHNKHDGTFEEIGNDTGTAFGQNGESTSSMGPVFADFEARGVLDLWVTDGHYNRLLHNLGKQGFEDMGASNGVSQTNAQYVSWGTGVYDFDNDGLLDILIFHGGLIHLIPQEHTLFRGLGNGRFEDVSRDGGPVLSERTVARGACFADYDNDGNVDAFLVNLGDKGKLLHDVSANSGHWVAIRLVGAMRPGDRNVAAASGSKSNRDGIGARVEVYASGKRWTSERVAASGYLSQDDARLHFGLGAATLIDKLTVHWPSGREQTLEKLAVDRVQTVEEPK